MKNQTFILVFFILLGNFYCFPALGQTTQIGGVINRYAQVNSITNLECSAIIELSQDMTLKEGDIILIIQMKGPSVDLTNNINNFGHIIDYNSCGNFEISSVLNINNTTLELSSKLLNDYDVSNQVQLVFVPSYNNASVIQTVNGQAWDGNTGGIIAMKIRDTLFVNEDIDASGMGFKGGVSNVFTYTYNNSYCNSTDLFSSATLGHGGYKGEGIYEATANYATDRGSITNGAGGGNSQNAGGGGGGNAGKGGKGGDEWINCGANPLGGLGGHELEYSNLENKIFLGGGGGGGETNNDNGTNGTHGGGIIIIDAPIIVFQNDLQIISNGLDNNLDAISDGAGGAGAGGTILINTNEMIGQGSISAQGGKGGNNINFGSCVAPGGGGGGGIIWTSISNIPININTNIKGGKSGLFINSNNPECHSTSYGAEDGRDGLILYDLKLNQEPVSVFDVLPDDTLICLLPFNFELTIPDYEITWDQYFIGNEYSIENSGWHFVELDNGTCRFQDSILVIISDEIEFESPKDTIICEGDIYIINLDRPEYSYRINGNDVITELLIDTEGLYNLTVCNGSCCEDYSFALDVMAAPVFNLPTDTLLCSNESHRILLPIDDDFQYFVNDELSNNQVIFVESGIYMIEVCNANCCTEKMIDVNLVNCVECQLYVPNIISPSELPPNDLFKVFLNCMPESFEIHIYDKWGSLKYHSTDSEAVWNGRFNNELIDPGVYTYIITFSYYHKESLVKEQMSGSATLIY